MIETSGRNEAHSSGVTWSAVIAGAFVASALSLILLALGTGIGLSAISPWSHVGAYASRMSWIAIFWLSLTQLIASSIGGYLAGRLRTKWVNIHTHEVYFRDTAHGFLVWAVGLVITVAFLTSAVASMVGGESQIGATQRLDPNEYYVDMLFRASRASFEPNALVRSEVARIFANALRQGEVPVADKAYLSELVVSSTGLSPVQAERRVSDVLEQARQAADTTRKAIAHSLYWTFLALLIGAFCASFAATIGGKQRDHVVVV
jgi:hypothetical protein